jgi:hypothetical protein
LFLINISRPITYRGALEFGLDAALPCLSEGDAIDAGEDVDAPWFVVEHEHLVRARQLTRCRSHVPEPELDECSTQLSCVDWRLLHEHVEIFREPWFSVPRDRVTSHEYEAHAI